MLNRVKLAAKLFCKKLKYDTSIVSLISYFENKKYKIIYFDRNSEDFKEILSRLHTQHNYMDLQSFTYRSASKSYVCIASQLNSYATRQCLLREAAHIELKHDTIKNISGHNFSMLCEVSDFARYVTELKKPTRKFIYAVSACFILAVSLSLFSLFNHSGNNVSQDVGSPISDSIVTSQRSESENPAETEEKIIFITKAGECYHTRDCRYAKNGTSITLKEAIEQGYRPCSFCNP